MEKKFNFLPLTLTRSSQIEGYGYFISRVAIGPELSFNVNFSDYLKLFPEVSIPFHVIADLWKSPTINLAEFSPGRDQINQLILGLTTGEISGIIGYPDDVAALRDYMLDFAIMSEHEFETIIASRVLGPEIAQQLTA